MWKRCRHHEKGEARSEHAAGKEDAARQSNIMYAKRAFFAFRGMQVEESMVFIWGAQVGSKSEAGGISKNPYWEEILMAKLLDSCLACLAQNSGRCVWPSKSPPNKKFREKKNQYNFDFQAQ